MFRFVKVLTVCCMLMVLNPIPAKAGLLGGGLLKHGGGEEGGCSGPGCNLLKRFKGGEQPEKEVQIVEVPAKEPAKKEDDSLPPWAIILMCLPFGLVFMTAAAGGSYFLVRRIQEG